MKNFNPITITLSAPERIGMALARWLEEKVLPFPDFVSNFRKFTEMKIEYGKLYV